MNAASSALPSLTGHYSTAPSTAFWVSRVS